MHSHTETITGKSLFVPFVKSYKARFPSRIHTKFIWFKHHFNIILTYFNILVIKPE